MNYLALLILAIGGIILTVGDLFMKQWVLKNNWVIFAIGLFIYLIGEIFLAFSFKWENIAVASVIFVLFNVFTLSLVSYLYFKEALSGSQIGGIILGVAAIILLESGK
jgi:multidrug transporter EmrE-like cation transporter